MRIKTFLAIILVFATLIVWRTAISQSSISGGSSTTSTSVAGSPFYAAGGGTANAQTVTFSPAPANQAAILGIPICWLPVAANTSGTVTLNVNSFGAQNITKSTINQGVVGGLIVGDLSTVIVACVIWDGTEYQLQNPFTTSGGSVSNGIDYVTFQGKNNGSGGLFGQLASANFGSLKWGVLSNSGSGFPGALNNAGYNLAQGAYQIGSNNNAFYYSMLTNGHQLVNTTTDPGGNIWWTVNGDAKQTHTIGGGSVPSLASGGGGTGAGNCTGQGSLGSDESGCFQVGTTVSTNSILITFGQPYTNPPTCQATDVTTIGEGVQCLSVLGGLASGTYTSGITATGSTNQTCLLTSFNGGGSSATATVALTGTNTIAAGTALVITANGTGYTSAPTSATAGNGTATCSGTATVATVRNAVQMTLNGFAYTTGAAANFTASDNVTWLARGH